VSVATDATWVYFADYEGASYVNKTTGGTVQRLISTLGYAKSVTVDPSTGNIWVAATNNGIIASCNHAGTCSQWTWTGYYPFQVSVIGGVPYVIFSGSGIYRCASTADCSMANATQISTFSGYSFTFDSTYLYFPDIASVARCPLTGCSSPTVIGQASGTVAALTSDSTWVYWLTDTGEIQKVSK
jgi:hypothetical protein